MGGWRVRPLAGEMHAPQRFSFKSFGAGGASRHVEPKGMRVLLALAAKPGEFISKDALIDQVWDGRPVTDDVLTHAIHALRAALDDDARKPRFIETRSNVGYRLLAAVRPESPGSRGWWGTLTLAAAATVLLASGLVVLVDKSAKQPIDPPSTIAVLPFSHLSGSESDDFLSAAMTEALILNLAQLPGIRVISRTSVLRIAHNARSASSIAQQLGADLLVEGSVQTSNGKIRVVAQLIDPHADVHLWAQHYDRSMDDVLALQQEIARAIALQIGSVVVADGPPEQDSLPAAAMSDFFQARYLLAQNDVRSVEAALTMFQALADAFPTHAASDLGMAQSLLFLFKAQAREREALDQALAAVRVYESLAGVSSESHRCVGQILLLSEWDFDAAEFHYQSAIALNPSDTVARRRHAWLLVAQQRYDRAAAEIQQVRLLDPLYYDSAEMATLMLYSGQIEAAVGEFERLDQASELSMVVLRTMGMAYLAAGRDQEAHQTLVRMLERAEPPVSERQDDLRTMSADELYRYIIEIKPFKSPIAAAGFHALRGNSAAAMAELERAVAQKDPYALYLGALPELAILHAEPRFQALLSEIGVKPESLEHLRETRLASANLSNPQTDPRDN